MSCFSYTYPYTAYGGNIFPWGYIVQNFFTHLSAGPFKGPYTITFSPSAIDTTYFGVAKIIYDFDDGSDLLIIEKDIIPNIVGSYQWDGNPASLDIPHDYYPLSDRTTTYNPTITVVNGNLVQNIYSLTFSFVPASLYDYESLRLINTIQLKDTPEEALTVFELSNPNYVTNVRIISTTDTSYNLPYTIGPDDISGLLIWLDAADALTVEKDKFDVVSAWRDKSGYNNHFTQISGANRPEFLYEKDTTTNRKSIKFTATSTINDPHAKFLKCINTTAFNTVTGEYTTFFVISPNEFEGTVLSQNAPPDETPVPAIKKNLEFTFISPFGVSIGQGTLSSYAPTENISLNLSKYSLFSVRIKNSTDGVMTADNLKFNLKRIQPFIPYSFGENNMPITISTQQMTENINEYALTNAEISEILVYNKLLTDNEFNAIRQYLIAKWGITYQTI